MADVEVRRATAADREEVLDLLTASLGWVPDALHDRFFSWKHDENPFGVSPAWVATEGDRILGFRTFLRWAFDLPDARRVEALRAVDTATHPDAQGKGIFKRLTLSALEDLAGEGVAFVFNTPNEQSRPGYLKMGWVQVGRLPVTVRFLSPAGMLRTARARTPADKWSDPSTAGVPAADALADEAGLASLLASQPAATAARTALTPAVLRWRYGFEPLHYRAVLAGPSAAEGVAVFRVRRRGAAREAVLAWLAVPGADRGRARRLTRAVTRALDADHLLRIGGPVVGLDGFVRLPGQGPILTTREVREPGPSVVGGWDLGLGDVELF